MKSPLDRNPKKARAKLCVRERFGNDQRLFSNQLSLEWATAGFNQQNSANKTWIKIPTSKAES